MSRLADDEVGLILNWVSDPNDRKSFSQVCTHWLRVEALTRLSIRLLDLDSLPSVLPRFPNLISFQCSTFLSDQDLNFLAQKCPKIELLNLHFRPPRGISGFSYKSSGFDDFGDEGLCALASGCRRLSRVVLRRRKHVGNSGFISLVNCAKQLTHLDLGWCNLVSDQALEAIGSASSISVLNLQSCSLITDRGLAFLASGSSSRSLKKLVLAECDQITDTGVSLLQKISSLEELDMADCGPKVTDIGCLAIVTVQTLKKLKLSWLINVSDITVVALAEHCQSLVSLDLVGCELITGSGIRAFANHASLEVFVLPSTCHICSDDLEHAVLGCKSLRHVVLDKGLRMWIPPATLESIGVFCKLCWRKLYCNTNTNSASS